MKYSEKFFDSVNCAGMLTPERMFSFKPNTDAPIVYECLGLKQLDAATGKLLYRNDSGRVFCIPKIKLTKTLYFYH